MAVCTFCGKPADREVKGIQVCKDCIGKAEKKLKDELKSGLSKLKI